MDDNLEVSFIPMSLISDGYCSHYDFLERSWRDVKKGYTHFAEGDIGVAKITPCFQNRKSTIFTNLLNQYGAGTTELTIIRSIGNLIDRFYLLWFFKSFYFINNGIKTFSGTAGQQRINKDYIKDCLLPLPPLPEQKRIVTKIEKLLPYVEEYDRAQNQLQAFEEKFPEDMKKSILQYAMEGKLVEQRPEEGTAKELLQAIRAEKEKLVEEKKIKKTKPLPPVTEDEKPFDIPESWEWVRLGDLFLLQAGKNIKADEIYPNKNARYTYPCYGGNGLRGYVDHYNVLGAYPLIGRQGALCGNINFAEGKFYATEHAVVVYCFAGTDYRWAGMFLEALNLNQYATATAQPGLAVVKINEVLIPLPPLGEQKRIVAKIEELLPLVEKIRKQ